MTKLHNSNHHFILFRISLKADLVRFYLFYSFFSFLSDYICEDLRFVNFFTLVRSILFSLFFKSTNSAPILLLAERVLDVWHFVQSCILFLLLPSYFSSRSLVFSRISMYLSCRRLNLNCIVSIESFLECDLIYSLFQLKMWMLG